MEKIGIYGSGSIGSSLATLAIGNGYETVVIGHSQTGIDRCNNAVLCNLDDLEAHGILKPNNKRAALDLLTVSHDFTRLTDRTFVFEAVAEDIKVKSQVYNNIENICHTSTIIATCTSSMAADDLSACLKNQHRFVIAHPFQPAHLQPLIEVSRCTSTSDEAVTRTVQLLETLDRRIVVLKKDIPGFIGNRLAQAMFREALYLIEQGIATADDIDKTVEWIFGRRYTTIGMMEFYDFVGFPLECEIASNVYPTLCDAKKPQNIVLQGLHNGNTGLSAGKGLHDWTQRDPGDFRKRRQAPLYTSIRWNLPE